MAKNKASQTAVWILLGLLILGLGGFGVTNFGGSARQIGEVNGQPISTQDYFRALRTDLDGMSRQLGRNLSFAEASVFGFDANTRARLVAQALIDAETDRLGVSVGDARLAEEIRGLQGFQSATGGFDRTMYRLSLEQNSWTEAQFEARLRADIARGVVQTALATGFTGSEAAAQTLFAYLAETRSFSVLQLTEADLGAPLGTPDAAVLQAHHAANPDVFTRPEARRITYAALLPQDVLDQVPVNEAELQALYQSRIDEFVQPERRLVERLVFGTDAQAAEARARLDAGTADFEALVAERGLTLDDVDMGDVSRQDLGAAADGVFALEDLGVAGPLPTPLGPALFRMNAVLAAQETTFDEAREALVAEFAQDGARRLIADRVEEIDDLLAGGATLEDLAKDAGMVLGTVDLVAGAADGIAAYPEFRDRANKATDGDFPEAFLLADGGVVALRLDAVLPPEVQAFDLVAEQVEAHWHAQELSAALVNLAQSRQAAVDAGAAMGTQGVVSVYAAMPREGRVDGAPADLMAQVFAMTEGQTRIISEGGFVALVRLDAVQLADLTSEDATAFVPAMSQRFGQQQGADAFELFARALEADAEIYLDQAAIDAVHAQIR